ncbi:MAG TPA: RidA family protein [Stellaceae bacterium]|nr:RidA family protein [Stellaceae bacterium]
MRIEHPYSMLVRAGGHAWTCGQCPLAANGAVLAPEDIIGQAEHVDRYIRTLLVKADYTPANVGKLVIYHACQEPAALSQVLSRFGRAYPGALLIPVGTPYFYYPGMKIEIDVHATGHRGPLLSRELYGLRLRAVDAGDLVWMSLEVLDHAAVAPGRSVPASNVVLQALREFAGISTEALLADHWFVIEDGAASALDALRRAGLITDIGAAVGVALPPGVIAIGELTFSSNGVMRSLARSPHSGTAVFARSSRSHFWIAARSLSGASLVEETEAIMAAISAMMRAQDWRFEDVTKATTHYLGSSAPQDLHGNMAVRNAYYRRPGPASTGLPVAGFPFSQSKVAVDVLGVIE